MDLDTASVHEAGYRLALLGVARTACPYDLDTIERAVWMRGWRAGVIERKRIAAQNRDRWVTPGAEYVRRVG